MTVRFTKEYVENTTGMTFEEFLDVVEAHSIAQNISLDVAKQRIMTEYADDITPEDLEEYIELYGQLEPAGTTEQTDTPETIGVLNGTEQGFVAQITDSFQTFQVQSEPSSQDGYAGDDSYAFNRPMVNSASLSEQLDIVFGSSSVLSATALNYSPPSSAVSSAEVVADAARPVVEEPQNIEPTARYDIFFGSENSIINGNLIVDNGYGADTDADGSVLNVVAGTFATDQGGTVVISDDGDFTYTPLSNYTGVDTFSYDLVDDGGATDTAEVTLSVTNPHDATFVDFSTANITGYGGSQNRSNMFNVEDGGDTIQLAGNTWKDITLSYTVTSDTVLEFDFRSTDQGEIHGIGFDTNDGISSGYTFKLYGTQGWGVRDFDNYAGNEGDTVHYSINVGDYYTGNFSRLFFVMDNDRDLDSDSFFSNIRIFEETTGESETITGNASSQSLYGNDGDDVIYGLGGDDVLYGGSGIDFLYGGTGADTFVLDDSADIDHVHDFNIGEGDALDLSDLLTGYDPLTDAINDFVSVTSDGNDTFVSVDADGGADNFVDVAILHNVSDLGSESDLETSGALITV